MTCFLMHVSMAFLQLETPKYVIFFNDSINSIIIQVNKKFCELRRRNIRIVEKAQETRFGLSPKYSRYIGIAS